MRVVSVGEGVNRRVAVPSSHRKRLAVALASLLMMGACASGPVDVGFGVATRLVFDGTVGDEALAAIDYLEVHTTGDEEFTQRVVLGRAASRTERFVYRPRTSTRTLRLSVRALGASEQVLAIGVGDSLDLSAGVTSETEVILHLPTDQDASVYDAANIPDASAYDGAISVPKSNCPQLAQSDAGVLVCAGFERQADSLTSGSTAGTATLDTMRMYRGTSSMHLHAAGDTTAGTTSSEVFQNGLADAPMYAARAFVYAPATLGPGTRLLAFLQVSTPFRSISIGTDSSNNLKLFHDVPGGAPPVYVIKTSATQLPLNRWVCLELRITWGDAATGHVRVLVDDVPVADLDDYSANNDVPLLSNGYFGMYYNPSPGFAYDLWIDELAIGTAPIGCVN